MATGINTVYYCVFIAIISGVGHPNSVVIKVRWKKEFKGIFLFFVGSSVVLFIISGLLVLLS